MHVIRERDDVSAVAIHHALEREIGRHTGTARRAREHLEQHGETRFLAFRHPLDVWLLATARPPDAVEVRLLSGNLKRLDGVYRLQPAGPGHIALRWTGLIEPDNLPPLLGELVMRATIEVQFTGMVREIERREALRGRAR